MNTDTHVAPRPIAFDPATRPAGVLIGFDGSTQSVLALHYAAVAARHSNRALTVITAFSAPAPIHTTLSATPDRIDSEHALEAAKIVLNDARRYLKDHPGPVVYRAERGDPAGVLATLSAQAQLVVVGARGRGGFLGRIMGSVSSALPAHAHCPTIVVPRHYQIAASEAPGRSVAEAAGRSASASDPDPRPVLVGVDGSQHSRIAALHAAQFAQDQHAPLHLLLVLPSLEGWLDWYPDLDAPDQGFIDRRRVQLEDFLEAEATWVRKHYPGLSVTCSVRPGDPAAQLSRSTREALLTVVGTRGRAGFSGALLGSVSRSVLLQATGPVMVVPELHDARLSDQPGPLR